MYDLVVIGAGSGGLACAKRAASHGASVAIIEGSKYGGTCVNVGCVPKKVMFNASHVHEVIQEAKNFGFTVENVSFDWGALKRYRDRYIQRLNTIYEGGIDKLKIDRIAGFASFIDAETLKVAKDGSNGSDETEVKGKRIVIAVGGRPSQLNIPGSEHVIDSDGFFHLDSQPKKVGVVGAGYIAVELAGVLHGLGSEVSLFTREENVLRTFDPMISIALKKNMIKTGMNFPQCVIINKYSIILIFL